MAKKISCVYLTLGFIFCVKNCVAKGTDKGSIRSRVNRLEIKTGSLQEEVDLIWKSVLHLDENKHGSRANTDSIENTDMDHAVNTIKKTEMQHFIALTRNGLRNEKQWMREATSNMTNRVDNYQAEVNTYLEDLNGNHHKLKLENQALRQTILTLQKENEQRKTESRAQDQAIIDLRNENKKIQSKYESLGATIDDLHAELMKIKSVLPCDAGWKYYDGHCYLIAQEMKTWDEALDDCHHRGGYLLEINGDQERVLIKELISDFGDTGFWIGATDRDNEGAYKYNESKQKVPGKFWDDGEPNNYGGYEHCAFMHLWSGHVAFWDSACDWNYYSMCEKS